MYIPPKFEITDKEEIFSFVEANAFGQLISVNQGDLFSTHIPFLLSNENTMILGHLAKLNPQHNDIDGQEVMITIEGPHGYISPSWYSSPGVPTWNYQAVHIYGNCKTFTEPKRLQHIIESLTRKYESGFATPWVPVYREEMLSAIIGVEIIISKIQCKYKLNQNRSTQDQQQVTDQLEKLGSKQLAKAMKRQLEHNK